MLKSAMEFIDLFKHPALGVLAFFGLMWAVVFFHMFVVYGSYNWLVGSAFDVPAMTVYQSFIIVVVYNVLTEVFRGEGK